MNRPLTPSLSPGGEGREGDGRVNRLGVTDPAPSQ
jgi:hypothetical protein